jgi:uncharacterized protein (TIGR02284 family)
MSKTANVLSDIVQVARDGAEFYDAAVKEVKSPQLRDVFARMAQRKRELIGALSSRIRLEGESAPDSGTFVGTLRKAYADVLAGMSSNEDKVYVGQLEDTEDRLLKEVTTAIKDTDEPELRALLTQHLPTIRACHDEMRGLKQAWAA